MCFYFLKLNFSFVFLLLAVVAGGPDGNQLLPCDALQAHTNVATLHSLRDTIQALQLTDSYLGQLHLGRQAPTLPIPSQAINQQSLLEWKSRNSTVLQKLLDGSRLLDFRSGSPLAAAALALSCLGKRLNPGAYVGRPVVSVLLNYFKRPLVVSRIAGWLHASCAAVNVPCELVVNVDNPHEATAWAAEAARESAPGFVVPVFSANLHEARGYNRAARLARGRYLVVWQDDQIPRLNGTWLLDMIRVFEAHPRLGILGMNTYRLCRPMERTNRAGDSAWEPDPATGAAWTYAQLVDFAPMAIRASAFWELGGLDEGWSRRGECGIMGDWELCARAWVGGWQVGYMRIPDRRGDGEGGGTHTPTSAEACWGRQADIGRGVLDKRYIRGSVFMEMCEQAWALNMLSFRLPPAAICPYNSPLMSWRNCSAPSGEQAAALRAALLLPEQ